MKKLLVILLSVFMVAALIAGCGKTENNPPAVDENVEADAEPDVEADAEVDVEGEPENEVSEKTIVDAIGREVAVPESINRIAVINRYNLELIRACGFIDKVVGVDSSIIENHIYWPEFTEDNSFGDQSDINYEAVAKLEPEVLVTAFYSEDVEAALEPFGIPVVSLIGYDQDINRQVDIIEGLFGKSEKSEALRAFFNEVYDKIASTVESIPEEERHTAVWESIKDYSIANGSNAWGEMIVLAGGINVFGDASFESSDVDAEAMIAANPDYAFKMVATSGVDMSGYTPPTEEEYQAAAEAYLARPGFDEIKAVQDGNVYLVTSFSMGGLGKILGSSYIAKWMYPEEFADFNPDDVFGRWLEEFQNIGFSANQYYHIEVHE